MIRAFSVNRTEWERKEEIRKVEKEISFSEH
jgi:hypothetical protein